MRHYPTVLGIGNILIDLLVRVSDRDLIDLGLIKGSMRLIDKIERARLLEFSKSKETVPQHGGSAPTTVITLAALGVSAGLSGKTGSDDYGRQYRRRLSEEGVVSFLSEADEPTGSSIILITPDGERTMNTFLGANRRYSPEDMKTRAVAEADYLFFTGYMWDTDGQKQALLKAVGIAKKARTRVVFDAADALAVRRSEKDFRDLITSSVDILLANAKEAQGLTGLDNPELAAKALSNLCPMVVVKNGKTGSFLRKNGETLHIPAFPVKTVDTTGAGDIYAAGLIYGLSSGWNLYRSGLFASYLASRIVSVTGAQFSPEAMADIRQKIENDSWNFR